jgi:hypothetical protein
MTSGCLKRYFPSEDATGKYKIEVVPTLNDFIILAQKLKERSQIAPYQCSLIVISFNKSRGRL